MALGLPARAVLDGAMGTALGGRGLRIGGECPEAWNVEREADVLAVVRGYVEAGADALQTNTFGGNRVRLASWGRAGEVRRLNVAGALIVRELRRPPVRVIGSVGPTGLLAPPEGDADLGELEDTFAEQAQALAEGGVDLLHLETFYHPKELRAALRGVRLGAPGMPVVASMTCARGANGYATTLGYAPEVMLAVAEEERADGVGVTCSLAPADLVELITLLRARTTRPLWVRPTIAPVGAAPLYPAEVAEGGLALWHAGADAVGGCCGSGAADIAALRSACDASNP